MLEFIADRRGFVFMGLFWIICGISADSLIYLLLPLSLIWLYSKGLMIELFLGFILILTLSDSVKDAMAWARDLKTFYIAFLGLVQIKDFKIQPYSIDIHKYFMLFFLFALVCIVNSPIPFISFEKLLSYALLFLIVPNFFVRLVSIYGETVIKDVIWLIVLLILSGLLLTVNFSDITYRLGRYRGIMGNPNGIGVYCVVFILFFSQIKSLYPKMFMKKHVIMIYAIVFISLLLSGARSSLIAVIIFYVFIRLFKISPFIGIISFILIVFISQYISNNIEQIVISLGLEKTFRVDTLKDASGRLIAWDFAWEHIQKNFFVGRGINYCDYLFKENQEMLSIRGHQGHAHNSYLTFWLDTGLIGLSLFIVPFIMLFYKMSKTSVLAIPALLAILFSNQFESWLTSSLNPFTIQILMFMAVIFISEKTKSNELILNK